MSFAANEWDIHKIVPYRLEDPVIYCEKSGIIAKFFQQFLDFVDIGSVHGRVVGNNV
jgi:hypothetical protein